MTIQYFDALAGAGKTHALANYADELARNGEKVLFVQPTMLLIDNTISGELQPLNPNYPIKAIHGNSERNVIAAILKHFRNQIVGGEIVFITHEAFMRLPPFEGKRSWTVLFDEVPQVDIYQHFNIADSHILLTNSLKEDSRGNGYARLTQSEEQTEISLNRIANNKRQDELLGILQPLARRTLSSDWQVYVRPEQYINLLKGEKDTVQLATHSLLLPSIFDYYQQVIIAGALFKESVLYNLWRKQEWTSLLPCIQSLHKSLRYQLHQNGSFITINYLANNAWSKSYRDKILIDSESGEAKSIRQYLSGFITNTMAGKPFV